MSDGSIFGPIFHGGELRQKRYFVLKFFHWEKLSPAKFDLKMVQKYSKNGQLLIGSEKLTASDCFLEHEAIIFWKSENSYNKNGEFSQSQQNLSTFKVRFFGFLCVT